MVLSGLLVDTLQAARLVRRQPRFAAAAILLLAAGLGAAATVFTVIRSRADGRVIAGEVRGAIHAIDPDVATSSPRTLEEVLAASVGSRRINVRLLEFFGQVAMLLRT